MASKMQRDGDGGQHEHDFVRCSGFSITFTSQMWWVGCLQGQSYPVQAWVPQQQPGKCSRRVSRNAARTWRG